MLKKLQFHKSKISNISKTWPHRQNLTTVFKSAPQNHPQNALKSQSLGNSFKIVELYINKDFSEKSIYILIWYKRIINLWNFWLDWIEFEIKFIANKNVIDDAKLLQSILLLLDVVKATLKSNFMISLHLTCV